MIALPRRSALLGCAALATIVGTRQVLGQSDDVAQHGIAMHGDVRYPRDFTHFDYANPDAPKGGRITMAAIGTTFDSTNPFILRGVAAAGIALLYDTLTEQSSDEPFTEYGRLARSIGTSRRRDFVEFQLRSEARWHDGEPVSVDDVIWTFNTLKERGSPFYRAYYANVQKAVRVTARTVRFEFDGTRNNELPLILGQLPILPKHFWESRDFEQPTLEQPLGSGPYRILSVDPGRSITYARVADYWGRDIPVNKGRYNFDQIRFDYYRDANVALEAFKAGLYDWRVENSSKNWATGYTGPAVEKGLIKLEEFKREGGGGMQAYVFNLRRPIFADPRVRRAIGYAFDFEWSNKNLFYGQYVRTTSYFANTEMTASGEPSPEELALLEPFRDRLPEEVFGPPRRPPVTDGSGNNRDQLREALQLFKEAGWEIRDRKLTRLEDGQVMRFEILLDSPLFERITGPFIKNLERLGIDARMRTVDTAQYQTRRDSFDYDMIVDVFAQSASPGNEQRDYWSSAAADQEGSRNTIGLKDPVVDALIDRIIQAETRAELVTACKALDRVLLAGAYVVPHWYSDVVRIARWDFFGHPETMPRYGVDQFAWWIDTERQTAIVNQRVAAGGG
jgi:microcin C transport system substrate-binding protein